VKAKVVPIDEARAERARLIDEYAEASIAAAKAAKLRKTINEWCDAKPASQCLVFEGNRYALHVSARKTERKVVNLIGLRKRLGARFVDFCTVTLTALKSALPIESDQALYIAVEEHAGAREIRAAVRELAA
jgi:hypothetical protein